MSVLERPPGLDSAGVVQPVAILKTGTRSKLPFPSRHGGSTILNEEGEENIMEDRIFSQTGRYERTVMN